jgi:antitoxin PrlF
MKSVTITSVSSKGQIVVPMDIRKEMNLAEGTKLMILTDGTNLLLKPVQEPKMETFRSLVKASRTYAKKVGLKKSDVAKAIKKARQ